MAKVAPEDLMNSIINNIKGLDGMDVQINSKVECIPTGIDLLDYIMGGGVPLGKLSTITGQPGGGKSLPVSAKVLTPTGWKLMGDIKVGDIVCGPNYTTTKVVGVFPQGELLTYDVGFLNGATCRCSLDHLWTVTKCDSEGPEEWITTSLKSLVRMGIAVEGKSYCPQWMTPTAGVAKFDEREVPIDPYYIGRYLMEPSVREDVMTASYAKELHELGLDVPEEKFFIPNIYLFNSIKNRYRLLAGLIKAYADGVREDHKEAKGYDLNHIKSEKLADDITDLVNSLGGSACVSRELDMSSEEPTDYVLFDDYSAGGYFPFDLTVKDIAEEKNLPDETRVTVDKRTMGQGIILTVNDDCNEECVCIKVDSEDGLFITDDFVVTHNTTVAAQYIVGFQKYNPESLAFYIDTEQGLSIERLVQLGCDPRRTALLSQGLTMEKVFKIVNKILSDKITAKKKDVPYIVIWDSESATPTDKAMEAEDPSSIMGEHARNFQFILNKMVPNIAACNTSLVVISQLRQNIVLDRYAPRKAELTFGGSQKITGGSAAEFLPFQLAFIRTKGKTGPDCKNENCIPIIGQANEIYFKKNKNFTPEIPIELVIDYDTGYSDFWSKERLLRINKCFKGAAWQTLDGCDVKHHRAEVKDKYDNDPVFREAFDKLYEEKKKELLSIKSTKKKKESEDGLSAEDEKLLEALGGNNDDDVDVDFTFGTTE